MKPQTKFQSPLFPTRRVITPILLVGFLIFLVSCSPTNNVQSTYQPQQSQDIGGGCGVAPQSDIENIEIKYVEIQGAL